MIIFMLLIAVSIMTYLIPANAYDRTETESGTTTVIVESYHSVEGEPVPLWEIPSYVMQGLINQADVIFPLLVIAGALEVLLSTGMFHAYCGTLAMKCKGKEKLFIPAILLLFAFIGITQSTNKFIGFAPLGVMLAATLGYDAIVGVAIVLLGVGIGFSTGILAPTTAVAQELAELQAYSGLWLRVVSFVLFYIVTAAYIIWYGERCKKYPEKSAVYGLESAQQFDLSSTQREIEKRHPLVLIVFIMSFGILMYGCITQGWGLVETAVCMFWMAFVAGLVYGYCPSDIAKNFVKGAKNMTPAALIVGLGATVSLILSSANVLDTVVYSLANVLELFPSFLKPAVMLIMNIIVNGFVTSGTGQAAVVMPVMVPLADVAGVTRQTAVLAYKFGDGFCNYVLPHASALMGFLGATGITYDRWMKFMGKLFGLWVLLGGAILTFAYFVQYS
ncbi:MAG: AbgT family transporter [Lachnospiraceae bacterium]|nr:AbgT family transporter [Lachnospiraceae bacterium]